jgi:hypothetical protein
VYSRQEGLKRGRREPALVSMDLNEASLSRVTPPGCSHEAKQIHAMSAAANAAQNSAETCPWGRVFSKQYI